MSGRVSGGVGAMRRSASCLTSTRGGRRTAGCLPATVWRTESGCKGRQGCLLERGSRCDAHKCFGTASASKGGCRGFPRSCIMAKRRCSATHGSSCRALCFLGPTRMIGELQIQRPLLYWDRARQPSTSIAAVNLPHRGQKVIVSIQAYPRLLCAAVAGALQPLHAPSCHLS